MRAEVSDKDKEAACGRGLMFTPSLTSPRRVFDLPRAPKTPTLALPRKRGREAGEGKKAPAIGLTTHSSLITHHFPDHSSLITHNWSAHSTEDREALP